MFVCQKQRKKIAIFEVKENQSLEQILWNSDDRVDLGIMLSLYTGLRIGELCALKWSNLDLATNVMYVVGTIERISSGCSLDESKTKVIFSAPKTEAGKRCIPLPKTVADHLLSFQSDETHYVLAGSAFPTEPHTFYIRYKRFLKNNGISEHTFHALRHTFATNCIEQGFDAKVLSEILRHSNVSTTLCRYVHPTFEMKRRMMELVASDSISGQKHR